MRRKPFRSLSVQLTLCLTTGVILILVAHVWLVRSERRLSDTTREEAQRLAGFLQAFAVHELHEGHHDLGRDLRILREIPNLTFARLHHRRGMVDLPLEQEQAQPVPVACTRCHAGESGGPVRREFFVTRFEGLGRVMTVGVPLRNGPQCASCHEQDGPVIAALHVGLSMEAEGRRQARARWTLVGLGAGLLVLALAGIAALSYRLIDRPMRRLLDPMTRLRAGDLAARARVEGAEEFRYLAESFNSMAARIEAVDEERQGVIDRQIKEIESARAQVVHQEKMASLGLLASGIAHEIGNPLAAVSAVAQLLRHRTADEFTREQVALILTHLERIQRIVREMSEFSRPPSQVSAPVEVNEVVEAAARIARYDRRGRGVELARSLSPEIPRVELVADHLFQVVLNLILNAFDAMPAGGTLSLRTRREQRTLVIEVADTGTGIDPAIRSRIFDPFFTTKAPGRGTGLGLSVSYGIVSSLGGRIDVESEVGRGSRFTVRLPLPPAGGGLTAPGGDRLADAGGTAAATPSGVPGAGGESHG